MFDRKRSKRFGSIGKIVVTVNALAIAGGVLGFTIVPASAAGTLSVTPNTNLTDGQSVTVSGSGFTAGSLGAIIECSNVTPQPTVPVAGNPIPVSCTNPVSKLVSTDGSGNVPSTSFTVHTGVVGPPATGTDSDGHAAATDAANFPCPPTAAQIAAGASCVIAYGDQANDKATQIISFASAPPPTSTTTTSTTSTTAAPSSGTTTTVATSTSTTSVAGTVSDSPSTTTTTTAKAKSRSTGLALTGSPRNLALLAIGGVVLLDLGYLAVTVNRRPRRQRT